VRVLDLTIHDSIAKRGVAHAFVPVFDGHLTGQQRSPTASAVFDLLQQIPPLAISNRGEPPVLEL